MNEPTPLVRLCGITKRYDTTLANDQVTLETQAGEIHAVLGENGAGKTTLMKILAGLERPDSGSIEIDGRPVSFRSPRDAARTGVGMVHQQFSLVRALTVSENLAIGDLGGRWSFNPRSYARQVEEQAREIGLDIRAAEPVWRLSIGERQRVEVLRLILRGSRILILDEPTSILAPKEAETLFGHLRKLASAGHAVLLVTHKVRHVLAVADRVSVLRRGRLVVSCLTRDLDESTLTNLMVGQSLNLHTPRVARQTDGEPVLRVDNLAVAASSSPRGLNGVSFAIRRGEILGVAGISGNGQDELLAALTGTARFQGTIRCECDLKRAAYIPADRQAFGIAQALSLEENLALRRYRMPEFSWGPVLKRRTVRAFCNQLMERLGIMPRRPDLSLEHFSGGNAQKAVLARELADEPTLILAQSPTAGVDLGTIAAVHCLLVEQAAKGAAVLLVSEDLDELLALADRILVLYEGRIVGLYPAGPETRMDIGLAMNGSVGSTAKPRSRVAVS